MEFSRFGFCAEDKMAVDFRTYPFLCGALIHQSSSMGIHKSGESPFVELTGHKPLVHSAFQMAKLNVTKKLVLTEKVHSFTNNTRNFMRGESFLQQKEICSHKFPVMALSQLVGGFVGSKSQLGSCGRESYQIWDIIFDKLAEFCRAPQSGCCSVYASKNPGNSCELGNSLSQEIFESFYEERVPTFDSSHIIIENSSNQLQENVSDTLPRPRTVSHESVPFSVKPSSVMSTSTQNDKKCFHTSDVSRQSYAEVAKAFAIAQQSNQQCTRASTMKRRRNISHCGNLRNDLRHFSWRHSHESSVRSYENERVFAMSCRKKPHTLKGGSMPRVEKSKVNNTDLSISESNRKKNVHEMKQDSQAAVSKGIYLDFSQVCDKSTLAEESRRTEDKSGQPCTVIKGISGSVVVGDCTVFTNKAEDGSVTVVIDANGIVQTSPTNLQHRLCSGESPARERCLSDCSTDSEDSFVSFEYGVDSSPVTVALVSDSEPSEDGVSDHFSDDDDDSDDDNEDYESDDPEVRNRDFKMWNSVM
jgi:hypothetical protein